MLGMAAHAAPVAAHAAARADAGIGTETDKGGVAAGTASQRTTPPDVIGSPSPRAEDDAEIVVTANRYGEAKVAAESQFDETEIAGRGADSIQDLLDRLSPFIGPGGDEPVILINGKPTGFDRSILSYPPEALQRLTVLKPEAAAAYGEAPGKRVVNLVLKQHFSMVDADARTDFATAGGQYGGALSAGRTAISGDTRWNIQARVGADSDFRKTARDLPPREGMFDDIGFITAPDGGEIDPALSLIAGEPVMVAALPSGPFTGSAPGLNDFAATANIRHPVNPNAYEALQSARRTASLSIGVTRPLGAFTATLNLNASRNSSDGERGLPMASVLIPAGSPWSPFADDVLLTRPFAGDRALRNANSSTALGASLTINGAIGSWQTNLGLTYSRNWARNLLESGVDVGRVQGAINAGDAGFDPYGPWDEAFLRAMRGRTRSENLGAQINVRKAIINLPAGPLTWNLTANISRNRSDTWQEGLPDGVIAGGGPATDNRVTRQQVNGQMTLSLPIARRGEARLGWLGDLSLDLSASAQTMTGSRTQKRYGANVSWSPWRAVQLRGSIDRAEDAPSFDQLDAPIFTTVGRLFDYVQQEVVDPVLITGGNPDLHRGSRRNVALAAMVRPLGSEVLTLNFGYRQSVAKGGIAAFPELTPAIEAAFPERVTRDAEGRLVAVDTRAINIDRATDADLSTGLALRLGAGRAKRLRAGPTTDPLQFSLSLTHSWRLKSDLLTRPGLPLIDQIREGGQSRHSLSLQANVSKRGIGANLNGNWSNAGWLLGVGETNSFRFKPPLTFNLSIFAEPDKLLALPKGKGALNGLRLSVDVRNLFNGYRRVMLADGSIPTGYSRNEIDPLGRTVQVSVRKRF